MTLIDTQWYLSYDNASIHSIMDGCLSGVAEALQLAKEHNIEFFKDLEPIPTRFKHFHHRCAQVTIGDYCGPIFPSRGPFHIRKIFAHAVKSSARVVYYGSFPVVQIGMVASGLATQAYVGRRRQSDAEALANLEVGPFKGRAEVHSIGALIHCFVGHVVLHPWFEPAMSLEDRTFNGLFGNSHIVVQKK